MSRKRRTRRTDPLLMLVTLVAIGVALTMGFQLTVHSGGQVPTVVNDAVAPMIADG